MQVALASCDPIHPLGLSEADRVIEALAAEGIRGERAVWTDPRVEWSSFDAVVIRSTWDYPERIDAFRAWLRDVERVTTLWHSRAFVEWNLHKRYLLDLGVAIPPTVLIEGGGDGGGSGGGTTAHRHRHRHRLVDLMDDRGWHDIIIKPAIGVTSIGIARGSREDPASAQKHLDDLLARGDAIVQPFLRSIPEIGETSMFFFGGEFSHAVRKRAKSGDYRVQAMWGGTSAPVAPTAAELALARATLAAAPEPLLYARVDTVRLDDGSPALMELEAIEPYLFLEDEPIAAARYARVIAARLGTR